MHPYSTDVTRPIRVMLVLSLCAVAAAFLFTRLLSSLSLTPPWWLDTPAVLGFYGLIWQTYDRVLWRLGLPNRTLSGITNLAGNWEGELVSSFDETRKTPVTLVVRQTSSQILITLRTETSESHSTMAALCVQPGPVHGLRYAYLNSPAPLAYDTMSPHGGTAHLVLSEDGERFTGSYQNDRFRRNHGRMSFHRAASAEGDHPRKKVTR
jgi:hypothetical protein